MPENTNLEQATKQLTAAVLYATFTTIQGQKGGQESSQFEDDRKRFLNGFQDFAVSLE